jgi:hypothetical protein
MASKPEGTELPGQRRANACPQPGVTNGQSRWVVQLELLGKHARVARLLSAGQEFVADRRE